MGSALVIGIAGGSASGKSTLGAALTDLLTAKGMSVNTLSLDAYFYSDISKSPTVTLPTGEVWFDRNHPDSADTRRLRSDVVAAVPNSDVVLVEGHFVLALDQIRELMDLKVYIDLEADKRALRRMLRDMKGGRGNTDPDFIATYFLTCARPGHEKYIEPSKAYADLLVRGDAPTERTASILSATIWGMLQARN